jgi:serine/threonine-protein kinase RsbW
VRPIPFVPASIWPKIVHPESPQYEPTSGDVRPPVLTLATRVIYSYDSVWPRVRAILRMRENARHVPETVERFLESTLESVDNAEELAVAIAEKAGFDEDDLMRIGMAVRESMVNAVVHGNRYNSNKKVRVSVANSADRYTVRIADEGEGFEYREVPDPLAPENLMRTSGRGLFLIRSFMDEFQVRRLEPGGTEVTLVKYVVSK